MEIGWRPGVWQIVKADFIAGMAAWSPPIGGAIVLAEHFGVLPNRDGSPHPPRHVTSKEGWMLAAFFLVLPLAVLLWRAVRIRAAFSSGVRVPGVVSRVVPFRGRAYFTYSYAVNGQSQKTTHFVLETDAMRRLPVGTPVTVAVSAERPKVAFVTELFPP